MKDYLKFSIDIYSYDIEFTFNKEKFDSDRLFVAKEDRENQKIFILVSNEWGSATEGKYLQCLTHECNHAAMSILGLSGVYYDYHNQEALCYLQDYIFRKCYDFCLENINGLIKE